MAEDEVKETQANTQQSNSSLTPEQRKAKQAKKRAIKEAKKLASIERISQRPTSNTFLGEHKWLGGAVDPKTGNIYGIPSHAIEVICISPPEDGDSNKAKISTIPLPNKYKEGRFKWLRGIIHDGYLYGIPAWSTHGVLKVRLEPKSRKTRGPRVKLLPLPKPAESYHAKTKESVQRGRPNMNM
jgi:hypothetical protein